MLDLRDITKTFGDSEVLRGVSAEIRKGEIFTIIGPSGAGKSTLLRIINLLESPSGGDVLLEGMRIHGAKSLEIRRRMGMVFQKPAAFNTSVYENVALGLRFRGEPEAVVRQKVADGLSLVGLSGFEERKAKTLSGGEMQRVALARVMVTDPEILLLDEPTANLDPVSVEMIEELILKINREFATTILLSTHDMFQGQRLADQMGVMVDGRFAQVGTPREIFTSPQDPYVARFVGIENIIDGTIRSTDAGIAIVEAGGVFFQVVSPLPVGAPVSLCLRPEDIAISRTAEHAGSVRNTLKGSINSVRAMGPLTRLVIDCGIPIVAVVTWKAAEELGISEGSVVCASFKATAVHVVKR
ncbi:MAG: ABC transporter ATP-binding protein [Methanocalculus sp. MSAO_Arc1]|uniref:ABC transporter ATP-binding protein n=1 Tax=Methanocalculus TaxID=71151 RepID=UPI000FF7930B|nr:MULTISPECIES: ABC transporter ATP-binding protein [unclassified Methanocalculus]MCP1662290.1 tungstate transport system ATP-binding protein [Methanocalculus sp. AMF5]RQD80956.1 MAG: ABC transporter ATP-binding protein [Methanocalculus sp. MSAO_Arc1]